MLKRKNRKGFTLAELLIVVAIIAVLVAIAVPLFVGSLNKAKEARDNANIRAVRGAAVVYLLEKSEDANLWYQNGDKTKPVEQWVVVGTIGANGSITNLDVKDGTSDSTATEEGAVTEEDGIFTVTVLVKKTEIKNLGPAPSKQDP